MAIAVKRGFGGGGAISRRPRITFVDSSLCDVEIRNTDIYVKTKEISLTASTPKYLFAFTCDDDTPFKIYTDTSANLRYRLRTTDLATEYINGYGATEVVLPKGSYRFDITSITNNSFSTGVRPMTIGTAKVDKNIIIDSNGLLNSAYTLQGIIKQSNVAVEVTRTQSTGVHGYIIGFDFTNISKLIFTIYSGASGYIYVRSTDGADQLSAITNDTSHILTYEVDVSAYTGEQPIIIACNNYATIQIRQITAT